MSVDPNAVWFVQEPGTKALPPSSMSFSALTEIEACPLRWSLRFGSYPAIWSGFGYPSNPSTASLVGLIVHRSLERVVAISTSANIGSVREPAFISAIRAAGGYGSLVKQEIAEIIDELKVNPRIVDRIIEIEESLMARREEIRERLQMVVSNLELSLSEQEDHVQSSKSSVAGKANRALSYGHYSEIGLYSKTLGWFGKVDSLKLSTDGCEITDFKSGGEKPEHVFQLNVYQILWHHDKERNPRSVPVSRLNLIYPEKKVDVPPLSTSGLETFAAELLDRTSASIADISDSQPPARVSRDNCCFCQVRQQCPTYWSQSSQAKLFSEKNDSPVRQEIESVDLEVTLLSAVGRRVWQGRVIAGIPSMLDTDVLLHFGASPRRWKELLEVGSCIRVLNGRPIIQQADETAIQGIGLTDFSEVFLLPK